MTTPREETDTGTDTGSPTEAEAEAETDAGAGLGVEADPSAGAADADVPPETASPEAALEAEVARWRDLAHRTAADLDNFRKRAAKERTDAIRYANASLLEELLPVIDNFEWGLQAASEDEGSPIYQGMSMVQKQLLDFLEGQGVETIDARGQEFDPNVHEAVAQEPHDGVPENHIISQTRKGYRLQGRLIRPASVTVSRGPAGDA